MISFSNTGRFVRSVSELPNIPNNIDNLYLDFETSSGNPKEKSVNPWHNCSPIGYAFTFDDLHGAYYVSCKMENSTAYLEALVKRSKQWVNHHVKYDAHVLRNYVSKVELPPLLCTVVASKLLNSDLAYQGGYGLDNVAKVWLHEDIRVYEEKLQPYLIRNKDYGNVPEDILAEYACQDALTERRLHKYIVANMPAECQAIWDTENELTGTLFDIEQTGMRLDLTARRNTQYVCLYRMLKIEQELHEQLGRAIRPHTTADCMEVLCNQFGLPVVAWTEKGEPSFNKVALLNYENDPRAPREIVQLISKYREHHTTETIFLTPYKNMHVDGILHCSYNQVIRTGRMSCTMPNMQQINGVAKQLIIPRSGCSFINIDFSQVEFRLICHYIQNEAAIKAYNENPDTDFHSFVADLCGIKRKPAKTVNFMVAFGGGKKKTVNVLSGNSDVVNEIMQKVASGGGDYKELCEQKAHAIYNTYHSTFSELKPKSREAASMAFHKGYVRNLFGRRRYLPADKSHIAFNSAVQSTAADIMKFCTVQMHKLCKQLGLNILASVHDSLLIEGPSELINNVHVQARVKQCMETMPISLRVPITASMFTSDHNWKEASGD